MRLTTSKKSRIRTLSKHTGSRTFRPGFETLESRLAMATMFGLSGTNLIQFDSASPTITSTTAITGVTAGETLVGIDFRPQNGQLYALGVAASGAGTLYNVSTRTGLATTIGAAGSVTPTAPMPDPSLATSGFAFDFNPLVDRIRVLTSAGQSYALDPNSGLVVANAPALNGGTTTADGTGYTNNQPNATATTLYTIDSASDTLYLQNPATSLTTPIGTGIGFDFTRVNGFDIPAGVNATTSGTPVATGSAFAILNVGGTTGLYSINLVTGAGTFVGNVGNGTTAVQGLAIQDDLGGFPAMALDASGPNLVRFNTATPGTTTTVAITGITAGETLVGIDFRPQTGQLFGLGINGGGDNGTLYRIDPQTGTATAVGTQGQVAYVNAGGTAIDLPDPATTGYGFDFNPTVDRIRVTTSTGLNFRIRPDTGAPVDGDTTTPALINPDSNINGSSVTGISATAYTNSFGQSLSGGVTTQYTLDAASNTLFIQNAPNAGTQTLPLAVTLGGSALDFTDVNGFDIPAGVRTATSNTAVVSGFGYAVLTVGGTTGLYRIDLTTGAATSLGSVAAGSTALAGFTLADAPAGTVVFTSATPSVNEGGGNATINLTRTGGTHGSLTVTVNVTGGSATAGTDFTAGPYTATFADGATTASFSIPITSDPDVEGDETVVLTIAAIDNTGAIGAPNVATLTIVDALAPPPAGTADIFPDTLNPGDDVLVVAGTPRSDSIVVRPANGQIRVILNGRSIGTFAPGDFDRIVVFAAAGNDTVVIVPSIDKPSELNGEAGNDNLVGSNVADTLNGGPGKDTLNGLGGDDTINGDDGNDVVNGGAGNDTLTGGLGQDVIVGGNGDDTISGGEGNDVLNGGAGNDTLSGDAGKDVITGGSGDDTATGGAGNDVMNGGAGDDELAGGDNNDVVSGDAGSDDVNGDDGNDTLRGGAGNDRVFGGIGDDRAFGDAGNDFVLGEEGNDRLVGGAGRDILIGGTDADTFFGEGSDDILIGGTTSADSDAALASQILAEWSLISNPYSVRITNILALGITVDEDNAVDTLFGQANQDWFLVGTGDRLRDKAGNETVT